MTQKCTNKQCQEHMSCSVIMGGDSGTVSEQTVGWLRRLSGCISTVWAVMSDGSGLLSTSSSTTQGY
ncbi:hypothetical protein PBY51_000108 [Eleginops maclovinus]|uniref:Uncharacterized protein n=1 Tax=Eleginops maclovinus TaxID=56733 RepID=A0AAN7XNR6_ELEMC|nr:hypothetical protein PBY51_000108 [Eleginops maclovinus]